MLDEFPSLNEPPAKFSIPETLSAFFEGWKTKKGFRILGENGPKLAHLRLISPE